MKRNTNIWINGIMGVIAGDALGCPVQFRSREEVAGNPVTGMRGYGTFNLPEGSWTDDSSLTLALLESIRRVKGIDLDDIMENFMKWMYDGEFTPYGYSYDIGNGTMEVAEVVLPQTQKHPASLVPAARCFLKVRYYCRYACAGNRFPGRLLLLQCGKNVLRK